MAEYKPQTKQNVENSCSNFYVVQTTSPEFGVHVGSMKFNTQNEETVRAHIITLNV